MVNPTNPTELFSPVALWNIIVLAIPIVISVVVATYKIMKVLRSEIRSEVGPIMGRINDMEKRFIDTVRAIWEDQTSQDIKIDAVIASHNQLKGAHEAIVKMGGHGEGRAWDPPRSGGDRRAQPRLPGDGEPRRCTDP